MTAVNAQIWHQIEIDVPRTRPGVPLWACEVTQRVGRQRTMCDDRLVILIAVQCRLVLGTDPVCVGDPASSIGVCPGNQ